jgi:hypothetical protein
VTAVTPCGIFLQRFRIAHIVHREFFRDHPILDHGFAPRFDVRRREVALERRVVGPEFAHADEAGVERVDGDVVGDAIVMRTRRVDEGFEVRQHGGDVGRRKAERAEHGDGGGHEFMLSPN